MSADEFLKLHVVPIDLKKANLLVERLHRHHHPVMLHYFSLGVIDETGLVRGCAIIGPPVARVLSRQRVAEVSRVATDGTRNACSMLLGAAARTAKAMGYERIQTYTLPEEGGASLRASGWVDEGEAGGGQWKHTDGKPRRTDQPTGVKTRWACVVNPPRPNIVMPVEADAYAEQVAML